MRSRIFSKRFRSNRRRTFRRKKRVDFHRKFWKSFNNYIKRKFNLSRKRKYFGKIKKVKKAVKEVNDTEKCNETKKEEDSDIEMLIEKMNITQFINI